MSEGLLNTILPILLTGVTAIGITTKGVNEHNVVNEMFERLKASGQQSMVKFVDIEYVCEDCKKNNVAIHCRHKLDLIPYWLNPERIDVLKLMVPDPDAFVREILGLDVDSSVKLVFKPDRVDELCLTERGRYDIQSPEVARVRDIYLSIDPSGGGKKSNYTIVSCIYPPDTGLQVVCFIELFQFLHGVVHRCDQMMQGMFDLFLLVRRT